MRETPTITTDSKTGRTFAESGGFVVEVPREYTQGGAMKTEIPGLRYDVPYSDYEAERALRVSALKLLDRSPAHYRAAPWTETAALRLGTAAHAAVLEPERFAADFAVWDRRTDSGRSAPRSGKAWDAFQAEHAGRTIITESERAQAQAIAASVRSDLTAMRYLRAGDPEVTMLWDLHGRRLKGRADWITEVDREPVVVGLKTSRDCRPGPFGVQAARLGYHMQWAWYADGFKAITGRTPRMVEVVVESTRPYAVATYHITDDVLDVGRDHIARLLDLLDVCEQSGLWPGPVTGEMDLELPPWAYGESLEITDADETEIDHE